MTLGELIDVFRREVFDQALPYLWSDDEVIEFANDAVLEAVRRGYQIIDASSDLCQLPYVAGENVLDLDARVIVIRQAMVEGQIRPLDRMKVERMDLVWPGWRGHTARIPTMYIDDYGSGQLRLYPTPTEAGAVALVVAREPLYPLDSDTDVPEIPARYHRNLVHWMKYRAFSKHDTETQDVQQAALAERAFAQEFGERKSARNERWQEEQAGVMWDTLA